MQAFTFAHLFKSIDSTGDVSALVSRVISTIYNKQVTARWDIISYRNETRMEKASNLVMTPYP